MEKDQDAFWGVFGACCPLQQGMGHLLSVSPPIRSLGIGITPLQQVPVSLCQAGKESLLGIRVAWRCSAHTSQ